MTPLQAEEILNNYWRSIKDSRPNAIVQSSKELPYTSARIKFAHFIYGEHLITGGFYIKGKSPEEMSKLFEKNYQKLMESYGLIDSLFSEDPDPINIEYKKYLEGLRSGIITNFRMPNPFGECEPVNEYHNFIGECWFSEHHTNLFVDSPLGAFIYDGIRNKAIKEKDIKLLIEIVNTSKTRNVIFPGRKTNEESIFVKPS